MPLMVAYCFSGFSFGLMGSVYHSAVYDLCIFDLDGTLVDSVGDIADALNRTLGTTFADTAVAGWVGSGVKVLLERAGVARADVNAVAVRFGEHYAEQPCKHTRPYLRVRETLRAITCD